MATDSRGNQIKLEPIKYYADYQQNWAAVIPPIRNRFIYRSAKTLSISTLPIQNFEWSVARFGS